MDEPAGMPDLDLPKINPRAHRAGLRRLSQRANQRNIPSSPCSTSSSTDSIAQLGRELADHLRAAGIPLAAGLSDHEFERIEALFGFSFPPDLRALLAQGVPSGPGFPDWRSASPATIRRWISMPAAAASDKASAWRRGGGGWSSGSGGSGCGKNGGRLDRRDARYRVETSPAMVPIFGLFFLPAAPARAGNPVFYAGKGSIVCCGGGIGEFLRRAFVGLDLDRGDGGGGDDGSGDGGGGGDGHGDGDPAAAFPFVIEEDERDEDEEEGSGERRRWSTSLVVENRPMLLLLEDRSKSLPGCRIEDREFDGWGRNLDALATRSSLNEALGKRRTKNTGKIPLEYARHSSSSTRAAFACYGSSFKRAPAGKPRWSGAHLDRIVTRNLVEMARIRRRLDPSLASSSSSSSSASAALSSKGAIGVRRIEFWSDVADRMIKQHSRRREVDESGQEQEEFELSMCLATFPALPSAANPSSHHRRTVSSSAAMDRALNPCCSSSGVPAIEATKSEAAASVSSESAAAAVAAAATESAAASIATNTKCDDEGPMSIRAAREASSEGLARDHGAFRPGGADQRGPRPKVGGGGGGDDDDGFVLSNLLEDVAARLRSAGWREEEIVEMVEGSSPKSVLHREAEEQQQQQKQQPQQNGKRPSVLESMLLSNSLKAAGFSVQEVSDALCFDLGVECRFFFAFGWPEKPRRSHPCSSFRLDERPSLRRFNFLLKNSRDFCWRRAKM